MKLKFDKEVTAIIDAIALLPDEATEEGALRKPHNFIGELDRSLMKHKEAKTLPTKQWTKLRRQLSFLFEIVLMASLAGKKVAEPNSDEAKKEDYRFTVKVFKKIHSGTALDRPEFVRIALNYGVLQLSDHEIQKLIDGNKV